MLAKQVPVFGGAARINRGPLLIGAVGAGAGDALRFDVVRSLVRECRRRRWWVVQIAPELQGKEYALRLTAELKLRHLPIAPWASGMVSLADDEERRLMALQGKWRNCLRKGWKLGVSVSVSSGDSGELAELLARYRQLQQSRGFTGISDALIAALARQTGANWEFTLFVANRPETTVVDDSVGMLVSVRHGDSTTYLIGATTEEGRKLQANYVLLWRAMQHAKSLGCQWFDIGGLNSTTPEGIAHFKQGLNPVSYALVGEWRGILLRSV